ncbi:MAG: hypothetical protein KDD52_02270 [Bdellovibrionales bacterium]|nr:hypothetical protein [Bdellovibrionales bacterium]
MSQKNIVHVVGTGTIGEPLIGLLCSFKNQLEIDEVSFSKKTASIYDRSKVNALKRKGASFAADESTIEAFRNIGITPEYTFEQALERASVVIDCTPVGNQNKAQVYENYLDNTRGFIAQGSEFGFGKMYARGINDHALSPEKDKFLQVVSCNTHNLSILLKTIGGVGQEKSYFDHGRFVCIRRANDISQDKSFIPAPVVNEHDDETFGTHHARDAHELFKTLGQDVQVFSSALKTNSQFMHTVWFHLKLKESQSLDQIVNRLDSNELVAMTNKKSSNTVFSFGRDHGHFGRILSQTVIVKDTLHVVGQDVYGWCFTPQDGNSLLSSVAAAVYFLYPQSYEEKINCLKPYFFQEI